MNLHSPIFSRKWLWPLLAFVACSTFVFALLPPAPERVDASAWTDIAVRTAAGAYHIHTTRSDGYGTVEDVARAASRAGLTFVILTDHGDGTRRPDPPAYIDGVLCLDAVEISTDQGHLVALDMPRAPYPLGGPAEAVVEDVHRLGGFAVAAHPDSPKPALRWTDTSAPIDGLEWLNADSASRNKSRPRLVRGGLQYLLRPAPALAALLDRPATLERWDRLSGSRPVVGLAASDAHGGVGQRSEDASRSLSGTIGIPSYEASFRTFSNRVRLESPLSGDPAKDARAIYDAIRAGRVYTTIDALASPGLLDFRRDGKQLIAHATHPPGAELALIHAAAVVSQSSADLRYDAAAAPGAYRVEVRIPNAAGDPPIPWLVSNFVSTPGTGTAAPARTSVPTSALRASVGEPSARTAIAPFPWRIEKDAASSAILRTAATSVELEYTLAGGGRNSQFVALASDLNAETFSALGFRLQTDRPARIWVQVRSGDGRRWGRTAYVDPAGSDLLLPLATVRPMGQAAAGIPASREVTSILLVIDLTNAFPGRQGRLTVLSSELVK